MIKRARISCLLAALLSTYVHAETLVAAHPICDTLEHLQEFITASKSGDRNGEVYLFDEGVCTSTTDWAGYDASVLYRIGDDDGMIKIRVYFPSDTAQRRSISEKSHSCKQTAFSTKLPKSCSKKRGDQTTEEFDECEKVFAPVEKALDDCDKAEADATAALDAHGRKSSNDTLEFWTVNYAVTGEHGIFGRMFQ